MVITDVASHLTMKHITMITPTGSYIIKGTQSYCMVITPVTVSHK